METFRELLEKNLVKNQVRTVQKELLKKYGNKISLVGKVTRDSRTGQAKPQGEYAISLIEPGSEFLGDGVLGWTHTVYKINGIYLILLKDVGTHPGLKHITVKNQKELKNVNMNKLNSVGDSYKKQVDMDEIFNLINNT